MLISHAASLLQRGSVPITFIRIFHFSHQLTVSAVWLLRTLGWLEHVLSDHTGLCAKCLEHVKTCEKVLKGSGKCRQVQTSAVNVVISTV